LVKGNKVIGIITMRGAFVHATSVLTIKEFLVGLGISFPDAKPMVPIITESDNKTEPNQEIESLLKTCRSHFNADHLTDSSACYKEVLKKAPNNAKALISLEKIETRYMQLIMLAWRKKEKWKVEHYLIDLYRLNPKSRFFNELSKGKFRNKKPTILLHMMVEVEKWMNGLMEMSANERACAARNGCN
jgi:hypothetical protein